MHTLFSRHRRTLVRWAVNAFIAGVLALILIDSMPGVPTRVRESADLLNDTLGIWQGSWNMFAPDPDTVNYRYAADIEYADGTVAHWNSPDWRHLSPWQNFVHSRYREYLDAVTLESNFDAWPALADHVARTHPGAHPDSELRRVTIWAEASRADDPAIWGWRPRSTEAPYGKRYVFYEREYP